MQIKPKHCQSSQTASNSYSSVTVATVAVTIVAVATDCAADCAANCAAPTTVDCRRFRFHF